MYASFYLHILSLLAFCARIFPAVVLAPGFAWSVRGVSLKGAYRSFLSVSNSAGQSVVTVWGVLQYWSCNSCFQSFPSNSAILMAFKSVLSTSPSLWGQEGMPFLRSIARYSWNPSNSCEANGGPLLFQRVSDRPWVQNLLSMLRKATSLHLK